MCNVATPIASARVLLSADYVRPVYEDCPSANVPTGSSWNSEYTNEPFIEPSASFSPDEAPEAKCPQWV